MQFPFIETVNSSKPNELDFFFIIGFLACYIYIYKFVFAFVVVHVLLFVINNSESCSDVFCIDQKGNFQTEAKIIIQLCSNSADY